jgi:hypothetical protein
MAGCQCLTPSQAQSELSDGHAGFKLTAAPPAGPAPTRLTESP